MLRQTHIMNHTQMQLGWSPTIDAIARETTEQMKGAELGVFRGHTSERLLKRYQNLFLFCVDEWEPSPFPMTRRQTTSWKTEQQGDEAYNTFMREVAIPNEDRISVLRMSTVDAWLQLKGFEFDWIIVDAGHDLCSVAADMILYWELLRQGGVMLVHDYGKTEPQYVGVTQAVDAFRNLTGCKFENGKGYFAILTK